MSKNIKKKIRILYLYDYQDWAIHNVGKLWLNGILGLEITYIELKKFKQSDFDKYDLIWFGYSDLFLYHCSRFYINGANLNKCIVTIHDPMELTPQQKNWNELKIGLKWWHIPSLHRWTALKILKKVKHIVTASKEMQRKLEENGIKSFLIPTTSSLPNKNKNELITKKCTILSVFENYPRKNIPLMNSLQNYCNDILKIKFDTKIGKSMLSSEDYASFLGDHEIYICTSFQEGGPIPAMDAMQRGSVVLSTPVGQIQDIIKDGENGFICKTKNEFIDKILLLKNDLSLLHKMRVKSLEYMVKHRNPENVKTFVSEFINSVLASNNDYVHNKNRDLLNYVSHLPILYLISFTSKSNSLLNKLVNKPA